MSAKSIFRASLALWALISIAAPAIAASGSRVYKFSPEAVSPLVALQEAAKLMDDDTVISQSELTLFKMVAAGRSAECDTMDTTLIVCGVTDSEARQEYIQKFGKIVSGARKAIAEAETTDEKAEALAKYLYKHPLRGGFVEGQINVAQLLDDGTFNCVSSAILYYAVAQKLEIKTDAEQIPQHVFLQTDTLCIEPTGGFTQSKKKHKKILDEQWATADPVEALELYGEKRYRRTNRMGLIGNIYSDMAGGAGHTGKEATASLKACCLCPTNSLYVAEAGVNLHNWAVNEALQRDYAKARKVAVICGQLYGDKVYDEVSNFIQNEVNTHRSR